LRQTEGVEKVLDRRRNERTSASGQSDSGPNNDMKGFPVGRKKKFSTKRRKKIKRDREDKGYAGD